MLEMKRGCKVPFPEKLSEGYEEGENAVFANLDASKVTALMERFINIAEGHLFFILELPTNAEDQPEGDFCNDIYYMDGLDKESALRLLCDTGELLVHDGMNTFGFGVHESGEEILFGKYNVMTVYGADTAKCDELFGFLGIKKTTGLVTAWDTFDENHPGDSFTLEYDGKLIYDIPAALREYGMYLAERRYDDGTPVPISLNELMGKTALVGISRYGAEGALLGREQFFGKVVRADEKAIAIEADGEIYTLPPDTSPVRRARPGEYKLRSTGKIIKDPDFLITWNVEAGE
jgi:hypothetical protein